MAFYWFSLVMYIVFAPFLAVFLSGFAYGVWYTCRAKSTLQGGKDEQ